MIAPDDLCSAGETRDTVEMGYMANLMANFHFTKGRTHEAVPELGRWHWYATHRR